jgi:hypothetical protein
MGSNGPKNLASLSYAVEDAQSLSATLSKLRCNYDVKCPELEATIFDVMRQLYSVTEDVKKTIL